MSESPARPVLRKINIHLRARFLAGLLALVPVGITIWILVFILRNMDGFLQPILEQAFGTRIPGLGLISLLVIIYLIGLLVSNYLGRWLINKGQQALLKIPIVSSIYSPAKQLIETFSSTSHAGFKRVVLIEYPRMECWTVGFLTGTTQGASGQPLALVYIPSAPTPYSGWVAILPIEQVYDTNLTVTEAMNLVVSGGIMAPQQLSAILPNSSKQ